MGKRKMMVCQVEAMEDWHSAASDTASSVSADLHLPFTHFASPESHALSHTLH